jgi:hypothetical protein
MKASIDLDVDAIIDKLLEVRGYDIEPDQSQGNRSIWPSMK